LTAGALLSQLDGPAKGEGGAGRGDHDGLLKLPDGRENTSDDDDTDSEEDAARTARGRASPALTGGVTRKRDGGKNSRGKDAHEAGALQAFDISDMGEIVGMCPTTPMLLLRICDGRANLAVLWMSGGCIVPPGDLSILLP
jgi:hypothetical protein